MISEGPAYEAVFAVLDSDHSSEEVGKGIRTGRGLLALIAKLGLPSDEFWVSLGRVVERATDLGYTPESCATTVDLLVRAKILEERGHDEQITIRISIPLLRKRYVRQNMYLKFFDKGRLKH
jgi:hypothetical protein